MSKHRIPNDEWKMFDDSEKYAENPVNLQEAIWDICDDMETMNFGDVKWKLEVIRRFLVSPPKEILLASMQSSYVCKSYTPNMRGPNEKIHPDCSNWNVVWKDGNGNVVEQNREKGEK